MEQTQTPTDMFSLTHAHVHKLIFHSGPLVSWLSAVHLSYQLPKLKMQEMKHLCMLLLQVIHLWFDDFALEDSHLCSRDFVTLRDDLGIMGEYLVHNKPK